MRAKRDPMERAAGLALVLCFAAQLMLVPGLHQHLVDGHPSEHSSQGFVSACADVAACVTQLIERRSAGSGSHEDPSLCPACMFLKNLQGGAGVGNIPVPALSPKHKTQLREKLHYISCTIVSSLPRGPPTT